MTEIPYRGSAPAINDLLGGNIDIVPDYLLANKQNIDAGKLKLLATGSRERIKNYPKVATIAETLPGVFADTWMAVAAPPGNAEGDHATAFGCDRAGVQDRGVAQAHPVARSRAARQFARRDAQNDRGQHAALVAGDRGGEGRHRLSAAMNGDAT